MHRLARFVLLIAFAGAACRAGGRSVEIATTTSVEGSGLLQAIRVAFEKQTEIQLNAFVVGSGRALVVAAQVKVDDDRGVPPPWSIVEAFWIRGRQERHWIE